MKFYVVAATQQIITFPDGRPLVASFQRKDGEDKLHREFRRMKKQLKDHKEHANKYYTQDEIDGKSEVQAAAAEAMKAGRVTLISADWEDQRIQVLMSAHKAKQTHLCVAVPAAPVVVPVAAPVIPAPVEQPVVVPVVEVQPVVNPVPFTPVNNVPVPVAPEADVRFTIVPSVIATTTQPVSVQVSTPVTVPPATAQETTSNRLVVNSGQINFTTSDGRNMNLSLTDLAELTAALQMQARMSAGNNTSVTLTNSHPAPILTAYTNSTTVAANTTAITTVSNSVPAITSATTEDADEVDAVLVEIPTAQGPTLH